MASEQTPSSVMFQVLKDMKVSNKDAAGLLLTDELSFGGQVPRDRIAERTYLHRVVHSKPGDYPEMYFADLTSVALTLCSRIVSGSSGIDSFDELARHLQGEPTDAMSEALRTYGLDSSLFRNTISKVSAMSGIGEADRASMMMLAFLAVGCYGSVARAAELVSDFLPNMTSKGFRTELAKEGAFEDEPAAIGNDVKLGLVRVIDGALDMNAIHLLSTTDEGTVIGSMSTDADSINDVGPLVSRRHARVFANGAGEWFVEGLGSTNGTTLVRGSDKAEIVVEPPKSERTGESAPVPLLPGDTICLADTTTFLAMLVR